MRRDVCDGYGLAGRVRGMTCRSTQISGRCIRGARRRASLGHRDLATCPRSGLLDRLTRSEVVMLNGLKEIKDVLGAQCRPQSEEPVIRIGEGPAAPDGHETRIAVFREDHTQHPFYQVL